MRKILRYAVLLTAVFCLSETDGVAAAIQADLSAYRQDAGVNVRQRGDVIDVSWPVSPTESGRVALELNPSSPLIAGIAIDPTGPIRLTPSPILQNVEPVFLLTVGKRDLNAPAGWVAFFDDPPKRPHQTYLVKRKTRAVKVVTDGHHCTIILDGLTAGPFAGNLQFTFYPGTRLIHVQAVMTTSQDSCAILYDAGLAGASPGWRDIAFLDSHDRWQRITPQDNPVAKPEAVRNRAIIAEGDGGSVAIFPPPHQYFYPLDFVDNFGFTWHGKGYGNLVDDFGFGIRQPPEGDHRHVPWINAPPGTAQKLGVFYLIDAGNAEQTLEEVRKYTHGDRFKPLAGYHTFTSHFHIEHTLDFLDQQKKQNTTGIPVGLEEPAFVKRFKSTGVDIVHLAEFHMDWTPELSSRRLDLLKSMHDECQRLSSDQFLLLPGEEPDVHLGGHWLSLFPKPVYWTLQRKKGQPFVEQVPSFGTVYHVGDSTDVLKLMEAENGLMWTAHARIKASFGFPDVYRNRDFFLSDHFLGAAWKAMPADNSLPRLGTRVLDLMDDMANWGQRKIVLGEVDVFKIHEDSELYGHCNINYLKLDKIPRFQDGWQPVLDALRAGRLFVTTGEVLIPSCTLNGKTGGEVLTMPASEKAILEADLQWTFPLAFAEIVSGDGKKVYRQHIDLTDTDSFGSRKLTVPVDLTGRTWARFEVWDIATNGAFTEPVWISR